MNFFFGYSNDTKKSKRRVSFATTDPDIHTVPNREDLLETSSDSLWYGPAEMQRIDQEIYQAINLMKQNIAHSRIERLGYSPRGLENKLRSGVLVTVQRRQAARKAVFEIQDIQKTSGKLITERIAKQYEKYTATSLREAIANGQKDEMEVQAMRDPNDSMISSSTTYDTIVESIANEIEVRTITPCSKLSSIVSRAPSPTSVFSTPSTIADRG